MNGPANAPLEDEGEESVNPTVTRRRLKARQYRSRAHISNPAVRVFLQSLGQEYDKVRGFEPYSGAKHFAEVLAFFNGSCCYCGVSLENADVNQDHLIPNNREWGGLHAWGNVVPSCPPCNAGKLGKKWADYLSDRAGPRMAERYRRINDFVSHYKYDPNNVHEIQEFAVELYEEVGKIAQALIDAKVARYFRQQNANGGRG